MRKLLVVVLALALAGAWSIQAFVSTATAEEGKHMFMGVAKCKTCHKKEEQGAQFGKWSEGPHAKAYETLASEQSLKIAKANGIENPQESETCLKCHVTGYNAAAEMLGPKYAKEDGVGCESCHGAGGDYYKKKTMTAITAGEVDGATVGLAKVTEETCKGCHNQNSPTFAGFDFAEYSKKIAHPWPEAYKASLQGGGSQ